ncbi:MAG TPA: single-stranded DNA-binding protein [Candidatus Enterococcus avicola]|uniref:Single-stranded DNA-binding protein n=1 Tax=Candidatus Enterococcus avicola TaxID=2838561 RepID=A0A9D2F5Y0_9ENTE|nr:single-stranded DNA-binding protein [Candidatus Enterococcus avicola]
MINNITLQGRLGKDVDLRYTASGKAVATISIGVQRNFKNGDNYETDWINVVFWGKQAETVANYFQKGSEILVTGSIQVRNYDNKQGNKVYITEVVAREFSFTSGNKKNSGNSQNKRDTASQNRNEGNYTNNKQNGSSLDIDNLKDMFPF